MATRSRVDVPAAEDAAPRRKMAAEDLPLVVLYEDEHLLAIDKPAGHGRAPDVPPCRRHADERAALAGARLARRTGARRSSAASTSSPPASSLVAKTPAVHAALQRAMSAADAEKIYLAVVYGRVNVARGEIDLRLSRDPATGGASSRRRRPARRASRDSSGSRASPRRASGCRSSACRLATGRTHQIRVHLAARGWPLVGDSVYGTPRWSRDREPRPRRRARTFPRQALHAWRLAFRHPADARAI